MEEEAQAELEAVMAMYGDDCRVLQEFPPHIHVSLRPRTADDLAQQFVEVVLGVRAGIQYPAESPDIVLVDSKGLDAERHEKLTTMVQKKTMELSSRPMLIALCEEAVDILTYMNHPEGNCPLCLDPLFQEDRNEQLVPFMKLMSCFHCFHCECILRWWHWVQQESEKNTGSQSRGSRPSFSENQRDSEEHLSKHRGKCPVCRKVFDSRDFDHILDLTESNASDPVVERDCLGLEVLHSDAENQRREQFEALIRAQREKGGLIEPKKDLVVAPGMFLPQQPSPAGGGGEGPAAPPPVPRPAAKVARKPVGRRRSDRPSNGAQSSRKQWVKKDRGVDFD